MSLVAAYSDSETESDSEEIRTHSAPKADFNIVSPNKLIHTGESDISNGHRNDQPYGDAVETETDSPHFQIEDDDDWIRPIASDPISVQQTLFAVLPQPKPKEMDIVEEMDDEFIKKVDKFDTVDEPLLEPIGSHAPNKDECSIRKKSSSLSLPPPSKRSSRKGPVKISIPSLDDINGDSDSDDENSKHTRKTIPACKTKSTLIPMLPKPRHSVTVGCNKNKMFAPQTNRPLIPHTLSKKTSTKPRQTKKTVAQRGSGRKVDGSSDSDDEEEVGIGNFFSLGDQRSTDTSDSSTGISPHLSKVVNFNTISTNTPKAATSSCSSSSSSNTAITPVINSGCSTSRSTMQCPFKTGVVKETDSVGKDVTSTSTKTTVVKETVSAGEGDTSKGNTFFANMYKSKDKVKKPVKESSVEVSSTLHQKQKQFSKSALEGNVTGPYGDVTGPYGEATGPYGDIAGPYGSVTGPYSSVTSPYGGASSSSSSTSLGPSVAGYPSAQHPSTHNFNAFHSNNMVDAEVTITEDALRQLQGSKRKHERINIIDIQGPDVRGDREAILRNATTDLMAQQKKKNDEDAPTGQQKRKHQIQYLAHQAKEREFQLQQQWAESRATKQVTQAKYGF